MPALCRTVTLVFLAACAASCNFRSEPEIALESYILAVSEKRCGDAKKLLSERTNHALDVLQVKPQHPQSPRPIEEYYCNDLIFEDCKPNKMTLRAQGPDTANISMPCGRTQDSFLPGFSSPFLKYEPRDYELVREQGEWHVAMPYVIRIVEVREREDQMRDAALERERLLRERALRSKDGGK